MSPLWRDEVGIYLSPHRLCLVRMQRGLRPKPVAGQEVVLNPKRDEWGPAVAALKGLLAHANWQNARLRMVVADHWVRYAVVPRSAELLSAQEREAHARQLLVSAYGEGLTDWELVEADAPPQNTRVVCAMSHELLGELSASCMASNLVLVSLQPQLVAAYEAWRAVLPRAAAWFVSAAQGSLAAARLAPNGWDRIYSVRIGNDWLRELRRLQTFGRLASSSPGEGHVYVDAPVAWREVASGLDGAGGGSSGLHWLDSDAPVVTTLQHLNRSRRIAA